MAFFIELKIICFNYIGIINTEIGVVQLLNHDDQALMRNTGQRELWRAAIFKLINIQKVPSENIFSEGTSL